jgi:hypothetical protein
MEVKEFETYDIYYDPEGDFLEITLGTPPEKSYADEIEPGVFISKDEETDKAFAVGILSFKRRCHVLNDILKSMNINFPLNISCS